MPIQPRTASPDPGPSGRLQPEDRVPDWPAQWVEAMGVPAWLQRGEAICHTNQALGRLAGRANEQLRDQPARLLLVADDRAAFDAAMADCLCGSGMPPAQVLRLQTPEGGLRPVEMSLRRIAGLDTDDAACALVTVVDQSDIWHVQNSLQAMGVLLRQIVNSTPIATLVVDARGQVTHWNLACERLTGRPAYRMLGRSDSWEAFGEAARAGPLAQVLAQAGEAGTAAGLEPPLALGDEAFFPQLGRHGLWLQVNAAPLHDADGSFIGAIQTLQDVTERHLAEDALLQHRQLLEQQVAERTTALSQTAQALEAFIEHAPFGVVQSQGHRVLRSNRKMVEILGPGQRPAGPEFHLADSDFQALLTEAGASLAQGHALHRELWLHHRDGHRVWAQVNAYATPGGGEQDLWWMLQDRSDVRAAQEELRTRLGELQETNHRLEEAQNQLLQADKMASIGQLAAGVAHEINNPIGFVSSNLHSLRQYVTDLLHLTDVQAEALARAPDPGATQRWRDTLAKVELDYLRQDLPELLDESAEGLARVKKIVQDLKDFSRVDQAEWQDADLNAGLESTLNVVRHELKYKAEVVRQLQPLPLVSCLAGQLNQVFLNLIVNAVHAIRDHGLITVSSAAAGDWVWVQVADNGCGMSEEVRRRVFEPFFTTKAVGQGTGLGLSLSFSIVQRHGGEIEVRSQPGQGSQFRVWIPRDAPHPRQPHPPWESSP